MEVNFNFTDTLERRRLQNRIAQRKFRQKKEQQRAANSLGTPAIGSPSQSTPESYQVRAFDQSDRSPLNSLVLDDADNFWDFYAIESILSRTNDSGSTSAAGTPPSSIAETLLSSPTASTQFFSNNNNNYLPPKASLQPQPPHSLPSNHDRILLPPQDLTDFNFPTPSTYPSAPNPPTPTTESWLSTLHIAAQKGHERIVRVLVQYDMNINEKDSDGCTPLMHAVIHDHASIVMLLLAHGANVREVDKKGRSALHMAVLQRRDSILRILLEHKELDVDAYDESGWTPLHVATESGFEAGVILLLQYGANLNFKARRCEHTGKVIRYQPF